MATIIHNKLVRDNIPDIISASGKHPVICSVPSGEILNHLDQKLSEESQEYFEDHSVEELADILEVLHGIAFHKGISWDEVESVRLDKRKERGGFEKGVFLTEVREYATTGPAPVINRPDTGKLTGRIE